MTTFVLSVNAALSVNQNSQRHISPARSTLRLNLLELLEIQLPVSPSPLGETAIFGSLRRVKRYVNRLSTVEDDGSEVLVEEGLDTDDLFTGVEEGEESSVHSYKMSMASRQYRPYKP
jgi:hypothetical protein